MQQNRVRDYVITQDYTRFAQGLHTFVILELAVFRWDYWRLRIYINKIKITDVKDYSYAGITGQLYEITATLRTPRKN